jgi:hypothetical protein
MHSNHRTSTKLNLLLVKGVCVLYLLGGSTIVIIGQDYVAIVVGALQVLASLEGFYAAARLNRRRTGAFLIVLILNTIATGVLGFVTFTGVRSDNCEESQNLSLCRESTLLYSYVGWRRDEEGERDEARR